MREEQPRIPRWSNYLIISPVIGLLFLGTTLIVLTSLAPLARRGALWQPGPEHGALFSLAITLLFILQVLVVGSLRWRLQRGLRYYDAVLAGVMLLAFGRMARNLTIFTNLDLIPTGWLRAAAAEASSVLALIGTGLLSAGAMALVISLTRAREENLVLQALGDVARPLSNLDLQETLCTTLVRLAELTGADACTIYLVERDGTLVPISTHQQGFYAQEDLARLAGARLQPGQGLVGWSASHGEPVVTGDAARDPRSDLSTIPGERLSMLVVPMVAEGRVIGAIRLTRRGAGHFTTSHLEMVRIFASQAAVVIENGRLFREVRKLSITDSSTGLFNSRHFGECLDRELRSARTLRRPLSLVMCDSDSLKQVNDRLGHPAGDMLIRTLGATIRSCIRTGDLVFRYAGDEFMVLLPGAPVEAACEVAERIRTAVQLQVMHYHNVSFRGTVSVGLATFPEHGTTADEMIRAADQALYHSKNNGRNRVTHAAAVGALS